MNSGDVYITNPAAILHGVSVEQLTVEDRSVALQCRTLLPTKSARIWATHIKSLSVIITDLLRSIKLSVPTYEEWKEEFDRIIKQYTDPALKDATIIFSNYVIKTKESEISNEKL